MAQYSASVMHTSGSLALRVLRRLSQQPAASCRQTSLVCLWEAALCRSLPVFVAVQYGSRAHTTVVSIGRRIAAIVSNHSAVQVRYVYPFYLQRFLKYLRHRDHPRKITKLSAVSPFNHVGHCASSRLLSSACPLLSRSASCLRSSPLVRLLLPLTSLAIEDAPPPYQPSIEDAPPPYQPCRV